LLAGPDGLDAYRAFFAQLERSCPRYAGTTARAPLAVAVEVGEGQALAVGELMRGAGFGAIEVRRDLAGIERVLIGALCSPGLVKATDREAER
jgi:methylase of polypeptide subunit release factors